MADARRDQRLLLLVTSTPAHLELMDQTCFLGADAFLRLSTLGWTDMWRAHNQDKRDYSYVRRFAEGLLGVANPPRLCRTVRWHSR